MICPQCRTEVPEGMKFCFECGHGFKGDTPAPQPHPAPKAERKTVTALFSDLSGYTAMTERLDPEQVREIIGPIFTGIKEIIGKYEGFIDRLLGDGVLAFFGIPKAHEDDPARAIKAALAIHEFVKDLSHRYEARIGIPLTMHSGVNTGLVVTAEVDLEKESQGVAGDAVNLAARLSGLAGPDEILVGEETVRRTRGRFEFQNLGTKRVKGKAEPVAAFKLTSARAQTQSLDRQVSSAMVGRDRELNQLELQVMKAINGKGSVVNVIGEAGIGKSRLLAELRNHEVVRKVVLLEGRAISLGKNLSFYPVADLLKNWARIREDEPEATALSKLETAIRRVCLGDTEEVFPFVATLMGLKLFGQAAKRVRGIEGEALEKLIHKNLRDLLTHAAKLQPIVIVIEDLHWADTSSLLLLDPLYRLAQSQPLVFINVFRPGYWGPEDPSVETLKERRPDLPLVEIMVRPLDRETSEALIHNMLHIKGLQHGIQGQIIDRTGGNPFFIEEVVRSLIDEGAIVPKNGAFELTEKIKTVVIPPTINDVLIARIDRLEGKTRELVKTAAVIGRSFFDLIIRDVAASIDGLDHRLAYLKDTQLIRDRVHMEELEYFFKHALAQEAAYESTLLQQRKALHLKVAKSIEKVFQERLHEFYGLLAFHYGKGEDLEKTEEYMAKAGEEALRTSASSEALHYYLEALRLYEDKQGRATDPAKLAQYEKNIAVALYNKAQWAESIQYYEKVLARWGAPLPKKGPVATVRLIRDFLLMIKALYVGQPQPEKPPQEGDIEIMVATYNGVLALSYIDNFRCILVNMTLIRRAIKTGILTLPTGWNIWVMTSGAFSCGALSFKLSNRMLEISQRLEQAKDIGGRIQFACVSTVNQHCQGTWDQIKELDIDLLDSSLGIGDFWHSANYLWFCGMVKMEQGEFKDVLKIIEILFDAGESYDNFHHMINAPMLKGALLIKKRAGYGALVEAEQGLADSREKGTELLEIIFLGLKSEAQMLLGDWDGADESLSQAKVIYDRQKLIMPVFAAHYLTSLLLFNIHRLEQEVNSGDSLNLAPFRKQAYPSGKAAVRNSRKYAPYRTKIFKLIGRYYWLIGKQRKALKWWVRTIQEGKRLGARPDLARTYFEVGKSLMEPQSKYRELNGLSAQEYFEKAEKLFREMDLTRDLEQLERVVVGE